MRARVLATLVAAIFPCLAFGDFEGILDFKLSGDQLNGTMRTWISKVGVRSESKIKVPEGAGVSGAAIQTVSVVKADRPTVVYMIDDSRKTYSVIETGTAKPAASKETYTVKRIGKGRIANFACDKVAMTSSEGEEIETCIAPDLLTGSAWAKAFQQVSDNEAMRALAKIGVKGMPIRWESKAKQGAFVVELVSAQKKSVPASKLEIPPGYTKSEMVMPGMNPEAAKQMEEAMKQQQEALKNLPPEQRKQMEEMMKKYGGGGQ